MNKPMPSIEKMRFGVFSLCILVFLFSHPAFAQTAHRDYWPTNGWKVSTPESQGMDSNVLANMLENTQKEAYTIDSITIIRNGVMVSDVYFHGFTHDTLHFIHSCTKSIMSVLIGIAIEKGYIKDIYQPVINFFHEKEFANIDESKKAMTLEHYQLFEPLGITDVKWDTNPQGITIGWGEMSLKPHDMAKIGYLYLKQGRWEDRQIVSKAWVEASTRKHISINWKLFQGYGYHWWVHSSGYYTALGYQGQYIFVIPQKNLVVVFTSDNIGDISTPPKLLNAYIKPAVKSDTALPSAPEANHRLNTLLNKYATSK